MFQFPFNLTQSDEKLVIIKQLNATEKEPVTDFCPQLLKNQNQNAFKMVNS